MVGMWLTFIFYMPRLCICISFHNSFIYACVKGELHLKSPPKIFEITIYVLSSPKRGRLLAQRPLARHFDYNKPYLVMFFNKVYLNEFQDKIIGCLTAPTQDSHFWTPQRFGSPSQHSRSAPGSNKDWRCTRFVIFIF